MDKKEEKNKPQRNVFVELKELGWEEFCFSLNRGFYKLKEDDERKFVIAEHCGELNICAWNNGNWQIDYCDLSYDEFLLFTRAARNIISIEKTPNKFTLADYNNAISELKRLCKKKNTNYFGSNIMGW